MKKYLVMFFLGLFLCFLGRAQNGKILLEGEVLDTNTKMPIPSAEIVEKDTGNGVTTDFDGWFQLEVEVGKELEISSLGYATKRIVVADNGEISVELDPETSALDEVIVVGYGDRKKATLTGAVSEVKGQDMVKSPQTNLTNSFAGRMPGIITTNRSGEPGFDDSGINIRGLATTGNNDALVVVDGVPGQVGGLSRLAPEDIESVSVLKDASAAIYGSRAANGVILVTTKRGKRNSKTSISYKFDTGLSFPTKVPNMANASTYGQIRNEIAYYNNPNDGLNQIYSDDEIKLFGSGKDPLNYPNTDWTKEVLKSYAMQTKHSLSITGGAEDINYFVSMGHTTQDGIYRKGATKYKQFNVRSNLDVNVTDNFTVGLSLSGRKEDRQFPTQGAGEIFRSAYRAFPTVPSIYPNGRPSTGIENENPVMCLLQLEE